MTNTLKRSSVAKYSAFNSFNSISECAVFSASSTQSTGIGLILMPQKC